MCSKEYEMSTFGTEVLVMRTKDMKSYEPRPSGALCALEDVFKMVVLGYSSRYNPSRCGSDKGDRNNNNDDDNNMCNMILL